MTDGRAVLLARLRHVVAARLDAVVVARQNMIVCGVSGAGKTSLLRAPLSHDVPPARRLVQP